MPILTETFPSKKRQVRIEVIVLGTVFALLLGVFAWSWFHGIHLVLGNRGVSFGYSRYYWSTSYKYGVNLLAFDVPVPGAYVIAWWQA